MTHPDPGPAEQWATDEGFEVDFADCSVGPIHYVAAGPETAPLVLLLHGFPDFWYTWRDHIAPLAAEYRVVAPDLRGYNRSVRPRGVASYRLDRLRTDVYELIQQLGYGTASVVGHDWGGSLALSFARHHPAHVDRLVVANTLDPERLAAQLRGRQLLRSWYSGFFQLPWLPERALGARDYRAMCDLFRDRHGYDETDIERYRGAWERDGALTASINYYRALGRQTLKHPLGSPARVVVPTKLLWGTDDFALRPSVLDRLASGIDDPTVERYEGASHWLHADEPDRFCEDVRAFLP
ncbi:alpha/beta fold hydrolase [Halosegnis longus]|uniref:Alpha/beta hydrolase n=1 Tax=Halosegnis longus TaxID=2216012 RepID=A0AAJ4RAA9_9EURY|nr:MULTISPECIES: alpha/beta hydrolase [Halobacteriales]RNJ27041.1 alpha/beta hydrolase [Salella cibi]